MSEENRVELSKVELLHACAVGVYRRAMHMYALAKGEIDPSGRAGAPEPWHEIEGAVGEYVVAKFLNINWPGDWWTRKRTADLLPDIEVRWTKYNDGHLLIKDGDPITNRYVLVVGAIPTYYVVGWVYGNEGTKQEYYRPIKPGAEPCFCVPQDALRSMRLIEQAKSA